MFAHPAFLVGHECHGATATEHTEYEIDDENDTADVCTGSEALKG